jgi:diaminohydroxyphosphoribosylaminopyrimidine deaminase/5-amino-6-(5-phosphoribosylamino)uracil reductase
MDLSLNPRIENDTDEHWMRRALALAGQSVGLASPNPAVGCVLVKNE